MTVFIALLPAYILSIFYRSFLSVIAGPVMADLGIGPAHDRYTSGSMAITMGWRTD